MHRLFVYNIVVKVVKQVVDNIIRTSYVSSTFLPSEPVRIRSAGESVTANVIILALLLMQVN